MAFSTQKDFFHVPFMNESVPKECKNECMKLKSYDSSIDDRSWAPDEAKKAKFLSDLVTCQFPAGIGLDGGHGCQNVDRGVADDSVIGSGDLVTNNGFNPNDSLLECANYHLEEYQNILKINTGLEKQLEVSKERLKTATDENKKIKEIVASKLDPNTTKEFYNKIQKLTAAGKLGKNEENELLKIYHKMKNMNKSNEILQAENNYLKRLIDKLAARVTLDNINSEPEESKDIGYLQNEVMKLRKECILLRQIEEDYRKMKQQSKKSAGDCPGISEQDAENIKAIIKERNSLREKCNNLKVLEQQVHEFEKKASEAENLSSHLSSNLNDQSEYINKMEDEMQQMQKYYEKQSEKACFREETLKAHIEDLKDDLIKSKCQLHKSEVLTMEVACMRNEVLKRDLALSDYDCQYKQLMDVVNELQAIKLQSLHDNQTQTYKNETDELAFFTRSTLDEIMKELKRRGSFNEEFIAAYGLGPKPNDTDAEYNQDCCSEMYRLQKQVEDMKQELNAAVERDTICSDALKHLEVKKIKLLSDLDDSQKANERLTEKLKESEYKMTNMLNKIERLDKEINENAQDANKIGRELEGTMGLVKDISDVQLKNQQLINGISAINTRDDQKIIDDLRRQLEEDLAKLDKCQQDNDALIKEAKERENDFKQLQDLNNKLEMDKKKLNAEKRKLQDDNNNLIYSLNNYEYQKEKGMIGNYNDINDKTDFNNENNIDNRKVIIPSNESIDNDGSDENKMAINKNIKKTISSDNRNNSIQNEAAISGDIYVGKVKRKGEAKATNGRDRDKTVALDDFVNKKSKILKFNLNQGRCLENELRKILQEYIQECGFGPCSCRLFKPKSKLHGICHKLYYDGINSLSFTELAYLHKKIYAIADKRLPGCLLDSICKDHKEELINMLTDVELNLNNSDTNLTDMEQKCCCCKNELCCNNSEETLKEKVNQLEKDMEMARKNLDTLKYIPLDTDFCDSTDNSTFRASSSVVIAHKKSSSTKSFKKLKERLMKYPEINRL